MVFVVVDGVIVSGWVAMVFAIGIAIAIAKVAMVPVFVLVPCPNRIGLGVPIWALVDAAVLVFVPESEDLVALAGSSVLILV